MGAFALSEMSATVKRLLLVVVPTLAFLVILLTSGFATASHYGVFLLLLLVAFFAGSASPQRMLAVFGAVIIVLLGLARSPPAGSDVVGAGRRPVLLGHVVQRLLARDRWLGVLKSKASSLLVMAILGARAPPLQGAVADQWSLQWSFVVPMVAFAYVTCYGLFWSRLRGLGRDGWLPRRPTPNAGPAVAGCLRNPPCGGQSAHPDVAIGVPLPRCSRSRRHSFGDSSTVGR